MSLSTQNLPNNKSAQPLELADTRKAQLNLLDFVLENKGSDSFIGYHSREIEQILRQHIYEDTILCAKNEKGGYVGVLLWSYESWIPLRIYVSQLVAKGCGGQLLEELRKRLPAKFEIYASRDKGRRKVIYKDPEKVIRIMKKLDEKNPKKGRA